MAFEEDVSLGRREQKKLATRRGIRDAALDLALQDGVEHLTVEAIAHAAGVSPRTFFNYFASKEDALVTEAAEGATDVRGALLKRPMDETPMRALHMAIINSEYFGSEPHDRERMLARQRLTQDHPSLMTHQLGKIASVERTFADALAERMGTSTDEDLAPEVLAALALSLIRISMRRWVSDGEQPLYELIDAAFEQCEQRGLFAPEAVSTG